MNHVFQIDTGLFSNLQILSSYLFFSLAHRGMMLCDYCLWWYWFTDIHYSWYGNRWLIVESAFNEIDLVRFSMLGFGYKLWVNLYRATKIFRPQIFRCGPDRKYNLYGPSFDLRKNIGNVLSYVRAKRLRFNWVWIVNHLNN